MQDRRTILKLWTGALTWLALGPRGAAAVPLRAEGGLYLVNGWLLTGADLQRLGIDAG